MITDPRAIQLWDDTRLLGRWLAAREGMHLDFPGPFVWDAYLLFGPKAHWAKRPGPLISWGWTLIGSSDELKAKLQPFLRRR